MSIRERNGALYAVKRHSSLYSTSQQGQISRLENGTKLMESFARSTGVCTSRSALGFLDWQSGIRRLPASILVGSMLLGLHPLICDLYGPRSTKYLHWIMQVVFRACQLLLGPRWMLRGLRSAAHLSASRFLTCSQR